MSIAELRLRLKPSIVYLSSLAELYVYSHNLDAVFRLTRPVRSAADLSAALDDSTVRLARCRSGSVVDSVAQPFPTHGRLAHRVLRTVGAIGSACGLLRFASGLAVMPSGGSFVVADKHNHRVQWWTGQSAIAFPLARDEHDKEAMPMDVAWSAVRKELFVVDGTVNRVLVVTAKGRLLRQWGGFEEATGIALAPDHRTVLVCDKGANRIREFSVFGEFVRQWGTSGKDPGQLDEPLHLAVYGTEVYVTDSTPNVQVFDRLGAFVRLLGDKTTDSQLRFPRGLCVYRGLVWVADYGNSRVQVYNARAGTLVGSVQLSSRVNAVGCAPAGSMSDPPSSSSSSASSSSSPLPLATPSLVSSPQVPAPLTYGFAVDVVVAHNFEVSLLRVSM